MSRFPEFTNHYRCPQCGHRWIDEGGAGDKGYCVECGTGSRTPYHTERAPIFRNYYRCWRCDCKWEDEWTSDCEDECPYCDARGCMPLRSRPLNKVAAKLMKGAVASDGARRRAGNLR